MNITKIIAAAAIAAALSTGSAHACGAGICAAGFEGMSMSGTSSWWNALGSYRLSVLQKYNQSADGRARLNRRGFGPYTGAKGDIAQGEVPKGYTHVTYNSEGQYTKFTYGKSGLSIMAIGLK